MAPEFLAAVTHSSFASAERPSTSTTTGPPVKNTTTRCSKGSIQNEVLAARPHANSPTVLTAPLAAASRL